MLQLLPESLRAWAALPAWETRPISRLDVPPVNSSVRFFSRMPFDGVRPGSGWGGARGVHFELERAAGEFGLARPSGLDFLAAGELLIDALDGLEQQLRLQHVAGVLLRASCAVRLRLSAHFALLTNADVVRPAVRLPQPVDQSLKLVFGFLLDRRRPGPVHHVQFGRVQGAVLGFSVAHANAFQGRDVGRSSTTSLARIGPIRANAFPRPAAGVLSPRGAFGPLADGTSSVVRSWTQIGPNGLTTCAH